MHYANKNFLILGLGESGLAMARWLAYCRARVKVADTREMPERLPVLRENIPNTKFIGGAFSSALLEDVDYVAISPGLIPHKEVAEILDAAQKREIPVWGETELFAQALSALRKERHYDPVVIAITGTNGKTTVTSMVGSMCRFAGKSVQVAGNISPAALDVLREVLEQNTLPEIWVLELSSFQLWSTYSLNPDAAAILNVTQDHLDWHESMEAYIAAKMRIFGVHSVHVINRNDAFITRMIPANVPVMRFGTNEPQSPGDFGLRKDRDMEWLSMLPALHVDPKTKKKSEPENEPALKHLMPAGALRIRGRHNASNALAALALCRAINLPLAPLLHALREYKGEPHRVEYIATVAGVTYFDDSKGTNVGATVAAIEGLGSERDISKKQIVLIAGGDGKHQDFQPLLYPVRRYVHTVILIGQDAKRMHEVLQSAEVNMLLCQTLEEAVQQAADISSQGDIVLLSPACASMDMFRNYAHRAQVFVDAVKERATLHGEAWT